MLEGDKACTRAGAKVRRAIVCNGATVGHDATLSEGCILSYKCVVGPGHTVPEHTRITLCSLLDSASDVDGGSSGRIRSRSGLDDDSGDEDHRLYSPAPGTLAVRPLPFWSLAPWSRTIVSERHRTVVGGSHVPVALKRSRVHSAQAVSKHPLAASLLPAYPWSVRIGAVSAQMCHWLVSLGWPTPRLPVLGGTCGKNDAILCADTALRYIRYGCTCEQQVMSSCCGYVSWSLHMCIHTHAVQAADQVRTQGASNVAFDASVVGNGAGFDYFAQQASQPTDRDVLTSLVLPSTALASQRAKLLSMQAEAGHSAEEEDVGIAERSMSPEAVFQREVQETLLRTMLLAEESNTATSSMTENAVIELNGLKIAGMLQALARPKYTWHGLHSYL